MTPPRYEPRDRWRHFLFYYIPLIASLALALYLATVHGDYNASLVDLYGIFAFLAPRFPRVDIGSMYSLNSIARHLAYLMQYGLITLLMVRALQGGAARLRRRSLLSVVLFSILFIGLDNATRNHTPGRHGGWDDIILSLLTVLLTSGAICIFFVVKQWEQHRIQTVPAVDTT